jgi:CheY-like chemotaxis protein
MAYILLVEDNQQNADLAIRLLTAAGYQVKHSIKGLQAAKLAREELPLLILMDFELPDVTGQTATLVIRKQLGGKTPPIVAVTGHATEADKLNAKKIGCVAFIAKPYPPEQLLNTVKYLLQHAVRQENVEIL